MEFVWNPHEEAWLKGIKQLNSFVTENSHARVPQSCTLKNGYKLGQWVSWIRSSREKLSQEKLDFLFDLGFNWEPLEDDWQTGVHHLRNFVVENSHAKVPSDFKAADGFKLGRWVIKRRGSKESLLAERVVELDKLGFVWNILEDNWQIGFTHLKSFVAKNSHAKVPKTFIKEGGYKLGQWVSVQRRCKTTLSQEKIALLDSHGFIWNTLEDNWQIGFTYLRNFVAENSHAKVPQSFTTKDGFKLGSWVSRQRLGHEALAAQKKAQMNQLGFIWEVSKPTSASRND